MQPNLDEIVRRLADGETYEQDSPDTELAARLWHAVPQRDVPTMDAGPLWDRVATAITEDAPRVTATLRSSMFRTESTRQLAKRRRGRGIAAVACGVAAAGFALVASKSGIPLFQRATPTVTAEYVTKRGERANIELNDGTQIRLNVDSRLKVIASEKSGRVVELDGEAQFTVTHDEEHPFVVKANGTVIRDLATVFNVKAYPHSGTTRVAVLDGRVSVQSPVTAATNAVVLDAMEFAAVNAGGAVERGDVVNMRAEFDWVNGMLVLDRVELGDALAQLARWYSMEFRVSDPEMLHMRVNLTLPERVTGETLRDIADVLGTEVGRAGDVVTFSPKKSL